MYNMPTITCNLTREPEIRTTNENQVTIKLCVPSIDVGGIRENRHLGGISNSP
jgi:hypothetical protein